MYGGIIFIVASFFMQLFFPDIHRFKDPDAALPEIALYVGGKLFQSIFLCTTFVNTLASGLASHASVSRLLYVMGRDNVFPERIFGYVHPKWRTPALNVIMVGIVALSALFFDLVTATALINFGALVAFTFVNLSVFNHFWRRKGYNKPGRIDCIICCCRWSGRDGRGIVVQSRGHLPDARPGVGGAWSAVPDLSDPTLPQTAAAV